MRDDNLDTPATSLWATTDCLKDGPDLALGKWLLRARTHLRHLVPDACVDHAVGRQVGGGIVGVLRAFLRCRAGRRYESP